MGSLCALAVAGVALFRSGNATFGFFVGLELALMTARFVDWQRRARQLRHEPGCDPTIDTSVILSTVWCTLQGSLAFAIMRSGDLVLCVLSATLVMALIGPLCARNYAAPRFAFLLVLLCDLPFVAGALASGEAWLAIILPMTPPFLLGAMQIIATFHKSMLSTLAAHAKVLHLAQHDSLTGILNRQGMDEALSQILPHRDRQMALICIDLDGFKQVNDQHGHGAGDLLLVKVAERLREQIRSEDLLGRMGGDEFMVVVRDMEPHRIGPLADRLISAISRYAYDLGGGTVARVGASIGFACLPEDAASTLQLRLRADEALYAAKGAGKGVGRRYGALAAAAPPMDSPGRSGAAGM
ncbi:GGDEF domain-containing protein [Sphingobium sp. SCG-1]|nr:GGDEF domain-containing protein [Sphingobium sp. SCG-1]